MADNSNDNKNRKMRNYGGLMFYLVLIVALVIFSTMVFGNNYGKKETTTF